MAPTVDNIAPTEIIIPLSTGFMPTNISGALFLSGALMYYSAGGKVKHMSGAEI